MAASAASAVTLQKAEFIGSDHDVMRAAQPIDLKGFGMIGMMAFNPMRTAADEARLFLDPAALHVNVEVRTTIGFDSLGSSWTMIFAPFTHVASMARRAVSLAFRGLIFASCTLCHVPDYTTWNGMEPCPLK